MRFFVGIITVLVLLTITATGFAQDESDTVENGNADRTMDDGTGPLEDETPAEYEKDIEISEKEEPKKKAEKRKTVRINWSIVPGANGYRVQARDRYGRSILDSTTEKTYYETYLDPGSYKIRIGSINKFGKVETWSEWSQLTVRESRERRTITVETYGPKIGIGYAVMQVLPEWDNVYKNNYTALLANIRFGFFNIKPAAKYSFFKHTGLELEFTYAEFLGRSSLYRVESTLETMNVGGNIFYRTHFKAPVNIIVRTGSGLTLSNLKYARYTLHKYYKIDEANRRSRDVYGKAGFSLEFMISQKRLFFELGADYYHIIYVDKHFMTMRYFALISAKI